MNALLSKYVSKLFIQQWIIGLAQADIGSVIRNRKFDPDIKWFSISDKNRFQADPFLFRNREGSYFVFFEDFTYKERYGKIALWRLDEKMNITNQKLLLDTQSHLSYPFYIRELDKVYVIPEAGATGKVSCYTYNETTEELSFAGDLLDVPLLDPTIIKRNNKYWLFGTMRGIESDSGLYVYYADELMGPYHPLPDNPVKIDRGGSRPAGKIIEVDGELYRPAQDSRYHYGGAITINKIIQLNEMDFKEEFYMAIDFADTGSRYKGLHNIHTINACDDMLVVDGTVWRFSIPVKWRQWLMKWQKN